MNCKSWKSPEQVHTSNLLYYCFNSSLFAKLLRRWMEKGVKVLVLSFPFCLYADGFFQLFPQHIFGCFKHLYFLIESITLYLIESITLAVIELFSVFQRGARGAKWIYCQLNSRAPSQSQTILYTIFFFFLEKYWALSSSCVKYVISHIIYWSSSSPRVCFLNIRNLCLLGFFFSKSNY